MIPEAELERARRQMVAAESFYNHNHNIPVAFYGLVVDQDTNPLPDVTVHLVVTEEHPQPFPKDLLRKATSFQRQTAENGRFQVVGMTGAVVAVSMLTKAGYEEDYPGQGQAFGRFGAQSGSFSEPIVFRMWSTNFHEPLIAGEKSFVLVPDGRRSAIDLVNGTITQGDTGDLVVWIKRPEGVRWGQRYDWSCELAVPSGGMMESESQVMFIAPEVGYTNAFAHQEQENPNRWSVATPDKRFYVQLRNGRLYGRISFQIFADYHGKKPALIRLSYAINPSGSRLLR